MVIKAAKPLYKQILIPVYKHGCRLQDKRAATYIATQLHEIPIRHTLIHYHMCTAICMTP
jgi:hypothetical protein